MPEKAYLKVQARFLEESLVLQSCGIGHRLLRDLVTAKGDPEGKREIDCYHCHASISGGSVVLDPVEGDILTIHQNHSIV